MTAKTHRVMRFVLVAGLFAGFGINASSANGTDDGCTLKGTNGTVSRTAGGRTYRLHVPHGLVGSEVPLLLSLHGMFSNGAAQESVSGWSGYAASHNFIVAYPQGQGFSFSGVWDPWYNTAPDITYLRAVVADIAANWCIDTRRVHVEGHSAGAAESQRVACDAADSFASVVSYDGPSATLGPGATPCTPSRSIAVGLFEGEFDGNYLYLSQNVAEWLDYSSCNPTPVHTVDGFGSTDTYGCAAGTHVVARVLNNTSHNYPFGAAQMEDLRNRIWSFFQAHPLP
jgi:polyhydroxybutyrate depolymerase